MLALLGDRYTRYLTPGAYAALLAKYERPADNGGDRYGKDRLLERRDGEVADGAAAAMAPPLRARQSVK